MFGENCLQAAASICSSDTKVEVSTNNPDASQQMGQQWCRLQMGISVTENFGHNCGEEQHCQLLKIPPTGAWNIKKYIGTYVS